MLAISLCLVLLSRCFFRSTSQLWLNCRHKFSKRAHIYEGLGPLALQGNAI